MFFTTLILGLSAILAVTPIQGSFALQGRMTGGSSVETLRRFPHHVLIKDYNKNRYSDYESEASSCGGSIVSERWILTAPSCCRKFDVMEISFQRLFLNKTNGSYSAVVNRDALHEYPTQYDDLALIKIPFVLIFSESVQPVELYSGSNIAAGQFVVLPGYDNSSFYGEDVTISPISNSDAQMVYGMFSISSTEVCKNDKSFDEFLQYCTQPWSNTRNSPSSLDIGSGLLIGWPARPQLIGIYSGSFNLYNVDFFTNTQKYLVWIRGVINNEAV